MSEYVSTGCSCCDVPVAGAAVESHDNLTEALGRAVVAANVPELPARDGRERARRICRRCIDDVARLGAGEHYALRDLTPFAPTEETTT